jgi:hypothetical protein
MMMRPQGTMRSPVAVAMTSPTERYRINAAECEREGDRATAPALKRKYQDLAQQWRDMAEQADQRRGSKRKNVRLRRQSG